MAEEKQDSNTRNEIKEYCDSLADRLYTIIHGSNVSNDWPGREVICSLLFNIQPNKCHQIVDIIGLKAPEYETGFDSTMDKFLAQQNIKNKIKTNSNKEKKSITRTFRESIIKRWMPYSCICCLIDQNKFTSTFLKLTQMLIAVFLRHAVPDIMIAYKNINPNQIISMDLCLIYEKKLKNELTQRINYKHAIYQIEQLQTENHTAHALYEHVFGPKDSDLQYQIIKFSKQNANQYVVRIYVDFTEDVSEPAFPAVVIELKELNDVNSSSSSKINNPWPLEPQTLEHIMLARKRHMDDNDNDNEGKQPNGISNGYIIISAVSYPTKLFGTNTGYSYGTKVYLQYNGHIRRFMNDDSQSSHIITLIPQYFQSEEEDSNDSKQDSDAKEENVMEMESLTREELKRIFDECDANGRNQFYLDQEFKKIHGLFKKFEQK